MDTYQILYETDDDPLDHPHYLTLSRERDYDYDSDDPNALTAWAYTLSLPHQCDAWEIGGPYQDNTRQELLDAITDLIERLNAARTVLDGVYEPAEP